MKPILQKAAKSIRRLIKDFKQLEQHGQRQDEFGTFEELKKKTKLCIGKIVNEIKE